MARSILVSLFALTLGSALTAVPTASAQTSAPQGDSNLLKALHELGYRYRVDSAGWTIVEVPGENGGTTEVHVSPLQNIPTPCANRAVAATTIHCLCLFILFLCLHVGAASTSPCRPCRLRR